MDLSTKYMGLALSSPLVASASPLTADVGSIRRLEDAGAAAVVLHSLFEEQIKHEARELDYFLEHGANGFAESLTYYPSIESYPFLGPQEYLDEIAKARKAVNIPVIASLNGISVEGITSYARQIQQAGASALEINVYFIPTDPDLGGEQIEEVYLSVLQEVKSVVTLPVAMKLSPFFSSMAGMARRLDSLGADALVLFNRFYQPDINLQDLEVRPNLMLSTSVENRLPMRWIAILFGKLHASLAATTGIHTAEDVAKMILAGADVTMMCSALLRNGIDHLGKVRAGLVEFMQEKEYESVSQMKGALSQRHCAEPAAFERANYMKTLNSYVNPGTPDSVFHASGT